ncbi:peptide chain release factor N(5)-glutamine methyltransferase [Chromohalobacter canadensis]|uniref:Release factor glutamine methyltransferase n=1 Tax=Chromohalobacter canadensis TaxID=141389 RepID=A0ABZ0YBV0_9GAMM|nr:peptide chain release factor N(5)-glutamine methyltransferase [Chromohalobacter canadensis]MCK0768253.1 peptide chain release factor N(5)-glutamine methyltransferase [Chromohalobacter canadensis]WQH08765.1 peptide chain release factor N(5)-glutamine methyltransferase [Chromohalobacter canadensis]
MTYDTLLTRAARRLQAADSASPRLDAEVLMMHAASVTRAWLYTWGDRELAGVPRARFEALVAARALGHPVAYLIGEREFWGLRLRVDEATLIPRPDTECLVETLLAKMPHGPGRALDLGTGTGAIALALASERPAWHVTGVDREVAAVAVAKDNAQRLEIANTTFLVSDWFAALGDATFDVIAANPPYIAEGDPHLAQGDVRFEPRSALVASDAGLADLRYLAMTARGHLVAGGWLALEHGWEQASRVREVLAQAGYEDVFSATDLGARERLTLGRAPVMQGQH